MQYARSPEVDAHYRRRTRYGYGRNSLDSLSERKRGIRELCPGGGRYLTGVYSASYRYAAALLF